MAGCGSSDWLTEVADAFNRHENRNDGDHVAACLTNGLTILRESLHFHTHCDKERLLRQDSVLTPLLEIKAKKRATEQIEAYWIAESVCSETLQLHQYGRRLVPAMADPNAI